MASHLEHHLALLNHLRGILVALGEAEQVLDDSHALFLERYVAGGGPWINPGDSAIVSPHGKLLGGPAHEEETILYAEIDLNRCVEPKQFHDVVGYYNRFDVFDLSVNRRRLNPVSFTGSAASQPDAESDHIDAGS